MLSKHEDREFAYIVNKLNALMIRTLKNNPRADVIIHDGYILLVKNSQSMSPDSKDNLIAKHKYISGKGVEVKKAIG